MILHFCRASKRYFTSRQGFKCQLSKVKYKNIAHFVGLDPVRQFLDAPTFDIDRARIPSELFKEIVEEIQSNMQEYGPPSEHENEEARSRYLAPVCSVTPMFCRQAPNLTI